ncbi:MAG: hypothetical protein IKX25_01450 [Bacteroidales bacterium]|nr:hypothetical protein [Bacteroidales bacterium]
MKKQKLKSERGSLNVGIKDIFMTLTPDLFRCAVKTLAKLRDTNKPGFNLVLEKFEKLKNDELRKHHFDSISNKRFIRHDPKLNEILNILLSSYWYCQNYYEGGYFWRMMPTKKENENKVQFDIRRKSMEDNLMQVMLDVLDDCDYYDHY